MYSLNIRTKGKNAEHSMYIFINEESFTIQVYAYLSSIIYENKRTAIAEYLTRANDNLPIGNFEFDIDSGEVRHKTSIAIGEKNIGFLTDEILDSLIWTNSDNMDFYYPGIMRINFSNDNIDVKAIIQEIEK